jgi:hypothetical protein
VVFFFPNDTRIRGARWLEDSAGTRKLVAELLPDQPHLWDGGVQVFRYKQEKRYVAALHGADGTRVALKFCLDKSYERIRRNASAFASRGPLRVARRLGFSNRHHVVAFEWLPGNPLKESTLTSQAIARVGAALGAVHDRGRSRSERCTRGPGGWAYSTPRSRRVPACSPCASPAAPQAPPITCPLHGDFSPRQVLLHNHVAGLVDFDEACRGEPASDLGNFIAWYHSYATSGKVCPNRVAVLTDALLEGYRSEALTDPRPRIAGYTAATLLSHAAARFQSHEPNWPSQMESLVDRAEAILNDG